MAVRFSWRRFKHQMDPLMLLWKQTLNPLPSPVLCLWLNIASNKHTEPFSSILKWPSLDYLSTNFTLTWGSSHYRVLIFFGVKSVRFQLRVKRKETDMPLRVESETICGTVPCCDVCSVSHVLKNFLSGMRIDPWHTFSLSAHAKVIVFNEFIVWDEHTP